MLDVAAIREDFPILGGEVNGKPLVYLDNAATAQKPARVIEKIDSLYRNLNANIHRGVHRLSQEMTREYEEARETIREFINARSREEVIFTSGATMAINLVAYSYGETMVGKGDNIILSEMEHHSNIVPWQLLAQRKQAEIRVLPFDDNGRMMVEELPGLIDEKTRMVAVTQASNVLGTKPDLRYIIDTAHAASVPVLVDGCQGIVHGYADMQEIGCDFYAFSGHKIYGPTGIGLLYARKEILENMPPFLGGGDMVATVSFEKTTFADLPLRFEAGTANYIDAIGMAEGIKYVRSLGIERIIDYETGLLGYAHDKLRDIDGLKIYGTEPKKCPLVSFTVDGAHPYDMGMILDKMGIAIRTGTHCAEPVMAHYGVTGMCRASFAFYNTREEVDKLAEGVGRAARMLR